MNKDNFLDILNDDDLGLLDEKKKLVQATPQDRLIQNFKEVIEFYEANGREPEKKLNLHERKLAARLESFRSNKEFRERLQFMDQYKFLDKEIKEISDIDDIFADDDLNLLDIEEESLYQLENVPKVSKKLDDVARRKPCKNFELYEPMFKQVHDDLSKGRKILDKYVDHKQLDKGVFFVAGGVLGVIVSADLSKDDQGRRNGRLYCVFENGTESNLLFQSLIRYLTVDFPGRVVVNNDSFERLFSPNDIKTGYIYILKSLSTNPEIVQQKDLYKIGFSEVSVEERIKNAAGDPTFLMAPVNIVSIFECYNMNAHRFERLIHRFFSHCCLAIDITNTQGERYTPKEWFIAPIEVIQEAIHKIIDGSIVNYEYDHLKRVIKSRTNND